MALCSLCGLCPLLHSAPSTALYPLYGLLPPPWSSVPLRPTVLSMALCLLYSCLFPSKALCPLFSPQSPSTIFCTPYGPISPLWPLSLMALSSLYGALFNLYGPLSSQWPSILSMTLCFLTSPLSLQPLSPLWPTVSSEALCPLF